MRNRENVKDTESNWLLRRREGNNGQDKEMGAALQAGKRFPGATSSVSHAALGRLLLPYTTQ